MTGGDTSSILNCLDPNVWFKSSTAVPVFTTGKPCIVAKAIRFLQRSAPLLNFEPSQAMSQNDRSFATEILGLSPLIRADPSFSSIPEGEDEDDDDPVADPEGGDEEDDEGPSIVLEGYLDMTPSGKYKFTPASPPASGSQSSAYSPPIPLDSDIGLGGPTLGRYVTDFSQGGAGSVPQQNFYPSAITMDSVSSADPPTAVTPVEEPDTVPAAAPDGGFSPAGANVGDPIRAPQVSVSSNSLETELTSLDVEYGDDQEESSLQSALMQTGPTPTVTDPSGGYGANSPFDFEQLDAAEAAGVEPMTPPTEEERVIPEPPSGGPPFDSSTGAGMSAVPLA